MNYDYYEELLSNLDPDTLVGDLGITTEDLMAAFPALVAEYIEENYL